MYLCCFLAQYVVICYSNSGKLIQDSPSLLTALCAGRLFSHFLDTRHMPDTILCSVPRMHPGAFELLLSLFQNFHRSWQS